MAKKKKTEELELVEIQLDDLTELHLEADPTDEAKPNKIERDPDQLIEWKEVKEPLQEVSLEVVDDEPPLVEEPVSEVPESDKAMGQGSWHEKYNAARRGKSVAVRKYTPVHRQR